jgi:hypothetical protein
MLWLFHDGWDISVGNVFDCKLNFFLFDPRLDHQKGSARATNSFFMGDKKDLLIMCRFRDWVNEQEEEQRIEKMGEAKVQFEFILSNFNEFNII